MSTNTLPNPPASKQQDEPQLISELDATHQLAHDYQNEPGLQDTGTLRATLAAEQARHMGASKLPEHTRKAIRDYARRQSGAPALDPDATAALSKQLEEAGLPQDIRHAIIEFAGGPRGVTGAPYFSPESNKIDTDAHNTVMALRSEIESGQRGWWRPWLAALMQPATLVMALFAAAQVWLVLRQRTGPFLDEAIYIDAGVRALQGYGIWDNYLTWFAGSLLWPIIASLGYLAGGLVGARLIAVACTTIAGVATASATRNLFGQTAGLFAAIAFALSGPVIHLAHLAVYDQIALMGVALSFWAITRASITRQRMWLVFAAISLGVGAISKYPMIVCLIPLMGVVVTLRMKRVFADLFILVFVIAALLLSYVLPERSQLVALLIWRTNNNPSFGVTTDMVRYGLFYYGIVVWALAIVGWLIAKGRRLAATLVGGMLLWPAYHVVINNSVGAEKHIVFGFVFGFPLVGAAFATMWWKGGKLRWLGRAATILSVLALAVIGVSQAQTLDAGWADTRPVAAYLMEHVKPGEILLISDAAPYQMELYTHDKISSPWDVYDTYRMQHNQLTMMSVCEADWFVDEEGGNGWPPAIRQKVLACGTFKEVFMSVSNVTQLGSDLNFVTYPVRTAVWVNIAKH